MVIYISDGAWLIVPHTYVFLPAHHHNVKIDDEYTNNIYDPPIVLYLRRLLLVGSKSGL
jgi:hypothetical protein